MSSLPIDDLLVTDDEETVAEDVAYAAGDRPTENRGRGVRRGSRRGRYEGIPDDARKRILSTFRAGGDWKMTADANGVPIKTAYGYISRGGGD